MADLSTLDATAPAGTDAVSGGDDAIRATRDAVKTSFGGTDGGTGTQTSEHYLKGFHKFPVGAPAARPTAGNAGRIYLDTTNTRIDRDTGAAWAMCNAVGFKTLGVVGPLTYTLGSWQNPVSTTIDTATGARLLVIGTVTLQSLTVSQMVLGRLLVDGVLLSPGAHVFALYHVGYSYTQHLIGLYGSEGTGPTAGSHTVAVSLYPNLGSVEVTNAQLSIAVL